MKSKIKIDELPAELLMVIFSYLSTYKKVSLVNKKFYEVACKVDDKNVSLTLYRKLFEAENLPILLSIACKRTISKMNIIVWELTEEDKRSIVSVLSKTSIKDLRIYAHRHFNIEMAYFLELLSLVPNAEHLLFDGLYVFQADYHHPETSNHEDVNLKDLRILNLEFCNKETEAVFNRLPAGVLIELTLREGGHISRLNTLFTRQTNIKKLSLSDSRKNDQCPAHIIDNMELESLKTTFSIETAALLRQTKLKSLSLNASIQFNEHLMKEVANRLTELEELNLTIEERPTKDIVNIQRMTNLKHLSLVINRLDIIDEFIQLDNSRLVSLEIKCFSGFTIHQIQILATSAPELKFLRVGRLRKWEQVTSFLGNFNFLQGFTVGFLFYKENYKNYLNHNHCANANLSELSFSINYKKNVIRKLTADFPNLKKLAIWSGRALKSSHFKLFLNGFTKLQSLVLNRGMKLTINDFKYLRDHGKHLQLLRLKEMNYHFANQYLEDVKVMFEVVKYASRTLNLKM